MRWLTRSGGPTTPSGACLHLWATRPQVSVAAGAHSSKAMRDGTFVVDLEHLKDIDLNTETNVVVVGSGCLIGEIDSV